jgi:alkanesulfonate monooxygenase SsuD/methylene tetrahydromethanopterin reductase-like flavin-dependent oxidoreductase (luciferase family)
VDVAFTLDFRNPAGRPWRELWEDNLWLMREAEAMGFDQLLIQEHFFTADGYGPSVPAFLAVLAQQTRRVRLGAYIYILPLHNPFALAQETAVLDHLSGGRLDVMVGAGHRPLEFRLLGIPEKQRPSRTEEGLELLKLAWTQHPLSYKGRYYECEDLIIAPGPLQQPHPPLWVAATRPVAAARAGRHGAGLAAGSEEPEVFAAYLEALQSAGFPREQAQVSKSWSITTTYEDPEVVWSRYADLHFERWDFYRQIRAEMGDPDLRLSLRPDHNTYRNNELIGSPEEIVETLRESCTRMPLTKIIHSFTAGIPVRDVAYASLRLFAEKVLPEIKSWPGPFPVHDNELWLA